MKIDRYIKDVFNELDIIASGNGNGKDEDNGGNDAADTNADPNDKSWFCVHCQKRHLEVAECRNMVFNSGDRWCTLCERVHYKIVKPSYYYKRRLTPEEIAELNEKTYCPKGASWCFYCDKMYVDEDEHFWIHEHDSVYISFIKENPTSIGTITPSWVIDRAKTRELI
jgi:hypothetical protein